MRLAIFSDTFFPDQINGTAHAAFQNAKMMESLGHEVMVFTVSGGQASNHLHDKYKFQVIHTPSLPLPGYTAERFTLPPMSFVSAQVKEFKPDIIHTHTPFAMGWEAATSAKKLGVPLVGTHHTFFDHYLKHIKLDYNWFKKPSWKILVKYYNQCDLVLSPSKALAQQLWESGLTKPVQVFSNAVDTDFFHPSFVRHPAPRTLIYMGRVSYEKSIDQVLQAFDLIHKAIPQSHLVIVGDGPERAKLEELTDKLGLTGNVEFTGMVKGHDLVTRLQTADVFVTASKSENQPLSLLEAMACGLPVVGVDALGVPEVVKNNENGFIVKPDEPPAFAQKCIELLSKPELVQKFSSASRELALNYSETSVAKKLIKIYEDLLIS